MILIDATIKYKGYSPLDLSHGSGKRICCSCNRCGQVRYVRFQDYRDLCISCNNKLNPTILGKFGKDSPNWRGGKVTLICKWCGKEFKVNLTKNDKKFCSNKCKGEWRSENIKGENHPRYGKGENIIGSNNPNWRGGKKLSIRRSNSKRKGLGFKPLNNWFNGCEGHHINNDLVIFIPKDLHRSIYHRQDTYQGMEEINELAIEYLLVAIIND